jgi:uncharacterized protein YukE
MSRERNSSLPYLYPVFNKGKLKAVQAIKLQQNPTLGEGLSFIPLDGYGFDYGHLLLDSESGQQPKKHQEIISQLTDYQVIKGDQELSPGVFESCNSPAKEFLEQSFAFYISHELSKAFETVNDFVSYLTQGLNFHLKFISKEKDMIGKELHQDEKTVIVQDGALVANLLAVDNETEIVREKNLLVQAGAAAAAEVVPNPISQPCHFTRSARFNSQDKMLRVITTGLLQEEQRLKAFLDQDDLEGYIDSLSEIEQADKEAIKTFFQYHKAELVPKSLSAAGSKSGAESKSPELTLKQAQAVNYILQQNKIHLFLDQSLYREDPTNPKLSDSKKASHDKFVCSTHLVSSMDSSKPDEKKFWEGLDDAHTKLQKPTEVIETNSVLLDKDSLLLTESSHSAWASRFPTVKIQKRQPQLNNRIKQLQDQIDRTGGIGFSDEFAKFIQGASQLSTLQESNLNGAEKAFVEYYQAVTQQGFEGQYDDLFDCSAFTFEIGDIAFETLANKHSHVSCKSGQDRTISMVAIRLAIAKCGWLSDVLKPLSGVSQKDVDLAKDKYKARFTAEYFKVIANQAKEIVEFARGENAVLKFQIGSLIPHPIPQVLFRYAELNFENVEKHWQEYFDAKAAMHQLQDPEAAEEKSSDRAASSRDEVVAEFKQRLQTVKMPRGEFAAYLKRDKLLSIFPEKLVKLQGGVSVDAFFNKKQSKGKKTLLSAFMFLADLKQELEGGAELSELELKARSKAIEYYMGIAGAVESGTAGKALAQASDKKETKTDELKTMFGAAALIVSDEVRKKLRIKPGEVKVSAIGLGDITKTAQYLADEVMDNGEIDLAVKVLKEIGALDESRKQLKSQFLQILYDNECKDEISQLVRKETIFRGCRVNTATEEEGFLKSLRDNGVNYEQVTPSPKTATSSKPRASAAGARVVSETKQTIIDGLLEAIASEEENPVKKEHLRTLKDFEATNVAALIIGLKLAEEAEALGNTVLRHDLRRLIAYKQAKSPEECQSLKKSYSSDTLDGINELKTKISKVTDEIAKETIGALLEEIQQVSKQDLLAFLHLQVESNLSRQFQYMSNPKLFREEMTKNTSQRQALEQNIKKVEKQQGPINLSLAIKCLESTIPKTSKSAEATPKSFSEIVKPFFQYQPQREQKSFYGKQTLTYSVLGNSKSYIRKVVEEKGQAAESKQSHTDNVIIQGIAGNISSALAETQLNQDIDKQLFAKTVIEFAQTYDGVGNAKDQSDKSKTSADLWDAFCLSKQCREFRDSFGLATKFSYEYQKAAAKAGYLTGRDGEESTVKNVGARLKRIPEEFNDDIIEKITSQTLEARL